MNLGGTRITTTTGEIETGGTIETVDHGAESPITWV
jgi:hypothetical protein